MSGSFILGFPGVAHVTNADGTVTLAPGMPITGTTGRLRKARCCPHWSPTMTVCSHPPSARPERCRCCPRWSTTDDAISTAAVIPGSKTLAPQLVVSLDSLFLPVADRVKPPKEARLRPAFLTDVDSFYRPALIPGPVAMQPGVVADADVVPAADVGWKVFAELATDADGFYGVFRIDFGITPEPVDGRGAPRRVSVPRSSSSKAAFRSRRRSV